MQKLIRFVNKYGGLVAAISFLVMATLIGLFDQGNGHNTSGFFGLMGTGFLWYWAGPRYRIWPWRQ